MLILPVFINKIEVKDNVIRIDGVEEVLKVEDIDVNNKDAKMVISKLEEVFDKHSKGSIILFVELLMAFVVAELIINVIIFKYLEKLFKNINREDTPFTIENSEYLRKMSWLIISSIAVGVVSSMVASLLVDTDTGFNISLVGVLEALFVFSMAYVFKYGAANNETKKLKKGKKDE